MSNRKSIIQTVTAGVVAVKAIQNGGLVAVVIIAALILIIWLVEISEAK